MGVNSTLCTVFFSSTSSSGSRGEMVVVAETDHFSGEGHSRIYAPSSSHLHLLRAAEERCSASLGLITSVARDILESTHPLLSTLIFFRQQRRDVQRRWD
jgi:hypothetical protein